MRSSQVKGPRGCGQEAGHGAWALGDAQQEDRLVADSSCGGVEDRNYLECGLRRRHIGARQDRVVVQAVCEPLSCDQTHAADRPNLARDEKATSRITANQCSPVRGHDMSLAYS